MKYPWGLFVAVLMCIGSIVNAQTYTCPKSNVCDTMFGEVIADPYRWMEIPETDSIKQWLKYQRSVTRNVRSNFNLRCLNLYSSLIDMRAGYSVPVSIGMGPYSFQFRYSSSAYNVAPVLYYFDEHDREGMQVAYDPNKLPGKGIKEIKQLSIDDKGRYLAVQISRSGSDWREIRVRDMDKGEDLPDVLHWVKFSNMVWWKDGFYYAKYDSVEQAYSKTLPMSNARLCYHKLGTSQQHDIEVLRISSHANDILHFYDVNEGRYLIVHNQTKLRGELYNTVSYIDMHKGLANNSGHAFIISPAKNECKYRVIGYVDSSLMVLTDFGASTGRLLAFQKDSLNYSHEILSAYGDVLQSVDFINNYLVALYFNEGVYKAGIFDKKGGFVNMMKFDTGVYISGVRGDDEDTTGYYMQSSYFYPSMVVDVDFKNGIRSVEIPTKIHYDPTLYETKIVHYKSKDGTSIPMYLTYKKSTKLKGDNPVLLYGYGGFGLNNTPAYNYSNVLFFDNGGILAAPLVRGGGELGQDWHKAGKRRNKQTTFDDFIAAADYLVAEGYTTRAHLAIKGGSNGGLLVAAAITQRPDLCKVAVAEMGAYDMLRYQHFTVGKYHEDEFGVSSNEEDYKVLRAYSPLHNIKDSVDYPATLLITGENDDRVPPLHTYKFLQTLQQKSSGTNPHIMYFEEDAGHQGAIGYDESRYTEAFIYSFMFDQFGLKFKLPMR